MARHPEYAEAGLRTDRMTSETASKGDKEGESTVKSRSEFKTAPFRSLTVAHVLFRAG